MEGKFEDYQLEQKKTQIPKKRKGKITNWNLFTPTNRMVYTTPTRNLHCNNRCKNCIEKL
jgi:hypothetical protein